jgi:hypothetical protein
MAAVEVSPAEEKPVLRVSLVSLIANPDAHDGGRVSVVGYVSTEYEDEILYIHREDYENSIHANGVGLALPEQMRGKLKSGQYAEVEGVFRVYPEESRSNGMVGRIISINKIEPWFFATQERQGRGCW